MPVRRAHPIVAVALLTLLAGCSSSSKANPNAAPSSAPTTSAVPTVKAPQVEPEPGVPSDTTLEKPKAAKTIAPGSALPPMPEVSQHPASGQAPGGLKSFPVPPGVRVTDPGAFEDTWQFDIHATDLSAVIDFYTRVLPHLGYTVRTDVTYTLAYDKVKWDLVFDGKVSGSMARDPQNGVVFVVINPPGQKAFAGD